MTDAIEQAAAANCGPRPDLRAMACHARLRFSTAPTPPSSCL
jgi:hypothetical protein